MDFESFDVVSYFKNNDVEFHSSGAKNVSSGWIGVNCPFCYDHSWHCGVNLKSNFFTCFICKEKGPINKLIRQIKGFSYAEINSIIEKYQKTFVSDAQSTLTKKRNKSKYNPSNILPKEASSEFPPLHLNYLRSRNFEPNKIIREFNISACNNIGKYKFRIIIPIIERKEIINFTARDVTNKSAFKYKHCPNDRALLPTGECVYGIDNIIGDSALLVEGPFDVWRVGKGALCFFGKFISRQQSIKIMNAGVKNLFVMLDSDAENDFDKACENIFLGFERIEKIILSDGDPADLKDSDVRSLRSEIFKY